AFGCIFADSPLERNGFELPVPRENGYRSESSGFVYLPETVRVSSKDLPTSGTEVSNPTNFRFPDQNQHIVREPATSGGGGQLCDTRRSSFGRGELPVLS